MPRAESTGSARFFRLDDLANRLAVLEPTSQRRLDFLTDLHNCDLLVLDDFLTTPVAAHTAAELLNILAAREGRGSTLVTSQFDPPDWYKSLQDAVIAESILNRIVAGAEIIAPWTGRTCATDIWRTADSWRRGRASWYSQYDSLITVHVRG